MPVELVHLPDSGHQVYASPRQRVGYLKLVFEWTPRWMPMEPRAQGS
jgi:hypothetical protein